MSASTLPNSTFPKPGEEIVWFSKSRKIEGKLIGYDIHNIPVIINQFDVPDSVSSFDIIRPKFPFTRIQPNWTSLLPPGSIVKADKTIVDAVNSKLTERIAPGPNYRELINEIYYRGYEVFLVGGTIRDYIQGEKSNDIDLVTTMPLKLAAPMISTMFDEQYSYRPENGYIRIGGTPASGDAFIDVKNFTYCFSGAGTTIFGSDLLSDMKTRDFACNSLYYDPINEAIIDVSGNGIDDAKNKVLSIVKDLDVNPHIAIGQIMIRYLKFICRGYTSSPETLELLKKEYCPCFRTVPMGRRMNYIKSQILSKCSVETRRENYERFVHHMYELEMKEEYEKFIKPFEYLLKLK